MIIPTSRQWSQLISDALEPYFAGAQKRWIVSPDPLPVPPKISVAIDE